MYIEWYAMHYNNIIKVYKWKKNGMKTSYQWFSGTSRLKPFKYNVYVNSQMGSNVIRRYLYYYLVSSYVIITSLFSK